MAEFKHITVTAADADDEVVVAGAVSEAPKPAAVAEADAAGSAGGASPSVLATGNGEGQSFPATGSAKRSSSREGGYRETTLDDLVPTSMPLAQKVVVIAAVVCIIGALVYYFAFMR